MIINDQKVNTKYIKQKNVVICSKHVPAELVHFQFSDANLSQRDEANQGEED